MCSIFSEMNKSNENRIDPIFNSVPPPVPNQFRMVNEYQMAPAAHCIQFQCDIHRVIRAAVSQSYVLIL